MRNVNNFKDCNLIFCSFVPVGLEDYVNYFINNFSRFTYLRWKFPHSKSKIYSSISQYKDKSELSKKEIFTPLTCNNKLFYFLLLPIYYFIYLLQAIIFLWKRDNSQRRIFFGINYFCTLCGIILKKLNRVDCVIYRVMDFFPLPKDGPYRLLVRIFYIIDKFCFKNADSIWFTTEGHIAGREKYGYFNRKKYNYQMIPLGLDVNKFILKPITEQNRFSLIYCGVISRYHLLDLLFQVVKELKINFKNIKLNLIGSGPDENYFKDLARKMGLAENIIFYGFIEDGEKFKDLMADNILGIALYKDEENFMKYTEPAKVKHYLSFGVPTIISDVPVIAKELHNKRVGFAVKNDKTEIVNTIKHFLINLTLQNEYKRNIKDFVKTIDINNLLSKNFQEIFRSQ